MKPKTVKLPSVAYFAEFQGLDEITYLPRKDSSEFGLKAIALPKWLQDLIDHEIKRQRTEALLNYQLKIKELLGITS